jgi:hypothetical protein
LGLPWELADNFFPHENGGCVIGSFVFSHGVLDFLVCSHGDLGVVCPHGDLGGQPHGDLGVFCSHGDFGVFCSHGDFRIFSPQGDFGYLASSP